MGGCFKLKEGFRLDAWKKYFTQRVVKQWYRLARKVVDTPSLEGLKTKLDGALSNLVLWMATLSMAEWFGIGCI